MVLKSKISMRVRVVNQGHPTIRVKNSHSYTGDIHIIKNKSPVECTIQNGVKGM